MFQNPSIFNADEIHRHLRKFGTISSIQLLLNRESEAHVTFDSDRIAYLVMLHYDRDRKANNQQIFDIKPAEPWDQPEESDDESSPNPKRRRIIKDEVPENEQNPEIFMLNDFCFLRVIEYLDRDSVINMYDTCKKFRGSIDKHNGFRRFKYFELNGYKSMPVSLNETFRTLRCIGPHVTYLKASDRTICKHDAVSYLRMLTRFLSSNLQRANFKFIHLIEGNRILIIAPILRHLETLEIYESYDHELHPNPDDIDFQQLCPNLVQLTLGLNLPFMRSCKPWPTLKHLVAPELTAKTLESFIEQNPQLISLGIRTSTSLIRTVAQHLPMIQKLGISRSRERGVDPNSMIDSLSRLQQLTEIKLDSTPIQVIGFERILNCLATLPRLRVISFICRYLDNDQREDYERSLINLAKQLNHLEVFAIVHVPITESTVVEFIRIARSKGLKYFYFLPESVTVTDEFVPNILHALRRDRSSSAEPLRIRLVASIGNDSGPSPFVEDAEANVHINPSYEHEYRSWSYQVLNDLF